MRNEPENKGGAMPQAVDDADMPFGGYPEPVEAPAEPESKPEKAKPE